MNKEYEVEFYKSLAKEIKPQGFKCFLYADEKDVYAWLCIITPNNSWLYVDEGEIGGYNIVYEYKPSKDFGSGCRCNAEALYEITADALIKAEQYGKFYGQRGCINVPNTYNGKSHRESVWRHPSHYADAYKAMTNSWYADKLVEL